MPIKNGRKTDKRQSDGTFAPGHPGGPGRPEGSLNKATLAAQELLDGEVEALTRKVIDMAKAGDITALRLCLDRVIPAKKSRPVALDLPDIKTAKDVLAAHAIVLRSMAEGNLTLDEVIAVSGLIENKRKAIEATDFEARLASLEKAAK